LHRLVDVSCLAARDLLENLPVGRIEHIDGLAGQGRGGLVGDEVVLHAAIVSASAALEITQETQGRTGFWLNRRVLGVIGACALTQMVPISKAR
jgi:hypothetical protein